MTRRLSLPFAASAVAFAVSALLPLAAQAQQANEGLKWNAAIYGWLPTISGSTAYPVNTGGASLNLDGGDVLDALKMTFMGALEVKSGKWGGFTDLVYADLGGSKTGTRDFNLGGSAIPADVSASLNLDLKGTIWTTAVTYNVHSSPETSIDLLGGARMLNVKTRLGWNFYGDISSLPLPGRSGSATVSDTFWDAVIGVKGKTYLGAERKWYVPYYLDVGTGETQSTWQGMVGIGYEYSWGSLLAAWRYTGFQMKSGTAIESMNFNGPLLGATFKW